jgi:chlorobactene glucosyltransferase
MANGQYMLFRRSVYDAIGGHESVRAALVEDVWLSRRVKAAGHRLVVMDGDGTVSCRMYTSLGAIWEGFSKNLFPGFRYSLPAMATVMMFLTTTSVLPFLLLPWAVQGAAGGGLIAAQVGLLLTMRTALAVRFRMAWWPVLLHALGTGTVVAIAVNSARAILLGGGAAWKGRRYDFHRHAAAQE